MSGADETPSHEHEQALERVSRELAAIGAETRTERRVKRVLPWVASLAIHLGVVTLALFITWTVANLPEKDDSILIVADFNALNYEPVIGAEFAQVQPTGPMARDAVEPLPAGPKIADQLRGLDGDPLLDASAALGHSGESGSSALSQFAPKAGANAVSFAGVSGSNARKIVYVMDATGTMISSNYIVIQELERSLAQLTPRQSFTVMFFQNNDAVELEPPGKLKPATSDKKTDAINWIRTIVPAGATNPLAAIDKALKLKPDVIFLLSTGITGYGQFEVDQKDLMKVLDNLNPKNPSSGRRATQIKCIQFLDADPLDTMKLIAQEHGGPNGYRFLSRKELGL